MERPEVPDVASKSNVMDFITGAYGEKGYDTWFEPRLRTGHFGCPQTRDRLIFVASLRDAVDAPPARPTPICSDFERDKNYAMDELRIQQAFRGSDATYPISMYDGRVNKSKELMRSLVIGDAVSCDLPTDAVGYGSHAGNKSTEAEEVGRATAPYASAASTPYIAYLRQGADDERGVSNHVNYALGELDKMRCSLVPYDCKGVGWREMAGSMNSMKAPKMMRCDDAQWAQLSQRWCNKIPSFMLTDQNAALRAKKKPLKLDPATGMPAVKPGWKLRSRVFPLVPYWCLTMKAGKDSGCYGRLSYDEPHPTVHSYHKPHWHPSLVPYAPRVMSVREKARIQGFPDRFVFKGTVHQQYKQIANAVSPQLTKALARSILHSALQTKTRGAFDASKDAESLRQVTYSESLPNFKDFMSGFDENAVARFKRHAPIAVKTPKLCEMTYAEFLMEYNTEFRSDHSVRNANLTPFQVLHQVEINHSWHVGEVFAVRWNEGGGDGGGDAGAYREILISFKGFTKPEWVDLNGDMYVTLPWKQFMSKHTDEVSAVLNAPKSKQRFGVPGSGFARPGRVLNLPPELDVLSTVNGEGALEGNGYSQPELIAAETQFNEWDQTYADDKAEGRVLVTNTTKKYDRKTKGKAVKSAAPAKKKAEIVAEEEDDDEEDEEDVELEEDLPQCSDDED